MKKALNILSPLFILFWSYTLLTSNHREIKNGKAILVVDHGWKMYFFAWTIPIIIFCIVWIFFAVYRKYPAPFEKLSALRKQSFFKVQLLIITLGIVLVVILDGVFNLRL